MAENNTAAQAPATTEESKAKKRAIPQATFATEAEAVKEAESRTRGPRRAFKASLGDKVWFVVGHNEGRAGGVGFAQAGGTVEEIGKVKKAKSLGLDGIMAAINALPADQKAAALAQINAMGLGKPEAKKAK